MPSFMMPAVNREIHTRPAASADTPLQEVLAKANDRFGSYGTLKQNPARASATSTWNIEDEVMFPRLPSMSFPKYTADGKLHV